ncbi:hypothetical protein ONE63_007166 [Megalurothrips usitatus]|uniref:Lipid storage droplets surface-binding protein 1 n=1 Tax=Megalurothrips usitatus TaxID=439358 RepID=A0AAV7XR63_9NEOP|nr:hypothetical protein ONE63_007166 [Megalurothrips usitatus]
MVTINEEFVANEQMNNYLSSDQPAGSPGAPSSGQAPAAAVKASADSASSSDAEDDGVIGDENGCSAASTPEPAPVAQHPNKAGKKAPSHDNHKNHKKQQKREKSGDGHKHGGAKNVNPVFQWSLGTAEGAVRSSLERSLSLLGPLSGPISVVDSILCRGLDMVEYNVPIITLPPELLMNAGRDYMSMRVVAPVLRMTATNARLADTLAARALDSADRYVDKYLPGDAATENGDAVGAGSNKGGAALQRADRLSRKLQRRLTRRTLAEARALRKDTENTLHTLVYFAETLVKDPRAFVEQCRAVWSHLSENEPENQVPPETLEERLALLVREVARRVVHLANYTAASANAQTVSIVANQVLKSVRVEGARVMSYAQSQLDKVHVSQIVGDVNTYTHQLLERLAHLLAGLRNSSHSFNFYCWISTSLALEESPTHILFMDILICQFCFS